MATPRTVPCPARRARCAAPRAANKSGGGGKAADKGTKKARTPPGHMRCSGLTPSLTPHPPCTPLTQAAAPPPPRPAPYGRMEVIFHSLTLIDSFKRATGRTLLPPGLSISDAPKALFEAPFVVVSHGTEADPVFNYGNAAALALWGLDWETFTALPSRKSASDAADVQAERAQALQAAGSAGAVDGGYSGVRVTSAGRRFRLESATLWGVTTPKGEGLEGEQGKGLGQAATFATVTWLDPPPPGADAATAGAVDERWRFAPGGTLVRDEPGAETASSAPAPPPPADAGALRAAVEAQAAAVRELKAGGRGNDDDDVAAAVAELKALKAQLAQLEAGN